MKRKTLKKMVCVSGLMFMTFPAWSAVPSNLLPSDGNWNQAPAIADVENPLFQGDMILARGGGGGVGGGGGGTGGGSGGGGGASGGELGSSYFLPRLIGNARAADILLTGRTVSAKEAEKIGLVSRLVPENRLMDTAMEIAAAMLEKTALGLRLTKETLNQNQNAPSLEAAVELENRNQSILCVTPEFFKAVEKFGKRKVSVLKHKEDLKSE